MKGPYERLKYDLRRMWECPVCKRRERTDGGVTFRFCECGTKQEGGRPVSMRLVADGPQRVVPGTVRVRAASAEEGSVPSEMASGVRVVERAEHPDSNSEATIAGDEESSGG
ncbi:MAG: hypothetical protein L0211_05240 [Planctomycetaceae bacterium]|nr:hypothetical protein [Planctomycetaceae bacterium]